MQDNIITQEEIDLLTSPPIDTHQKVLVESNFSVEDQKQIDDCHNSPEFKEFFKKICNHSAFKR